MKFSVQSLITLLISKEDLCDLCAQVDLKKKEDNLSDEKINEFERHIKENNLMREEKKKDKESCIPVLNFDLENVLTYPKEGVKIFLQV